jgi:hypothetical protein
MARSLFTQKTLAKLVAVLSSVSDEGELGAVYTKIFKNMPDSIEKQSDLPQDEIDEIYKKINEINTMLKQKALLVPISKAIPAAAIPPAAMPTAAPDFHSMPVAANAQPQPAANAPPPLLEEKDPDLKELLQLFDKVVLPPIDPNQQKKIDQYSAILQAFIETLDADKPLAAAGH